MKGIASIVVSKVVYLESGDESVCALELREEVCGSRERVDSGFRQLARGDENTWGGHLMASNATSMLLYVTRHTPGEPHGLKRDLDQVSMRGQHGGP